MTYATFQITINREARWIECVSYDTRPDMFRSVAPVALARVGRAGTKLWPSQVYVWRDKAPNAEGVYGWRAGMNCNHLNRQAMIVDWNKPELTKYLSRHNSAYDMPLESK